MPRRITPGRVRSNTVQPRVQATATKQEFETQEDQFRRDMSKATVSVVNASVRNQIRANEALKDRKDRTSALEATNEFTNWNREYKNNLAQKQGKDALGSYDQYQKDAAKRRNEILDNLDENAKNYAQGRFASIYDSGSNFSLAHQERQAVVWDKQTRDVESQTAVQTSVDSVTLDPKDTKTTKESLETLERNVIKEADIQGWSPEVKKQKLKDVRQGLYAANLNAITKNDSKLGKQYLEANKDKFRPAVYKEKMKELEVLAKKQDIEDTVTENSLKPIEEQLDLISKKYAKDADSMNRATKLAKRNYENKIDIQNLVQKKKLEDAADTIRAKPFDYKIDYSKWDIKHQDYLDNLQTRMQKADLAKKGIGSPTKTNVLVYNEVMNKSPEEFQGLDMTDPRYVNNLSEADYKSIVKLQKKNREAFTNVQSKTKYVNDFVKSKDDGQANFMREMFEDELNKYPVDQRNRMETWNKVRDQMLMEMEVDWETWDKPYWEAKYLKETIVEPDTKPKGTPEDAQWIDKNVNGKSIRGWKHTNAAGVTFLYTPEGAYRVD